MECTECGESLLVVTRCSSCGRDLCSACFGEDGPECRACVHGESGPELPSIFDGEG